MQILSNGWEASYSAKTSYNSHEQEKQLDWSASPRCTSRSLVKQSLSDSAKQPPICKEGEEQWGVLRSVTKGQKKLSSKWKKDKKVKENN